MNSVFLSFVLKAMLAALVSTTPITAEQLQGFKSDLQMVYRQDMLGTGESFNGWNPVNPLLVINPVDPRGVVVPTSTVK